jgi:hypothetical protein
LRTRVDTKLSDALQAIMPAWRRLSVQVDSG